MVSKVAASKSISRSVFLTCSALFFIGCGGSEYPRLGAADMVLLGGDVVTLEAKGARAQAIAIVGNRIALVGSDEQVRGAIGPNTRVIKLDGATVTPGLIDSHAHLVGLGAALEQVNLKDAESATAAARLAADFAKELPAGEWVGGRGWDQNRWKPQVFPDRAALDAVITDRPVALRRIDGHAMWVNSVALQMAGITRTTPDPAGGKILKNAAGEPSGVLIDNAMDLVFDKMPAPNAATIRRRILKAARIAVEHGLTTVHDMGISPQEAHVYEALADQGRLPLRVYGLLSGSPEVVDSLSRRMIQVDRHGEEFFVTRAVKLFADGALGSRGAALREPYSDDPKNRGLWVTSAEDLKVAADKIAAAGWQLAIHAIGDAANTAVLDAYEAAYGKHKDRDLRFRIEHAQVMTSADIERLGKLGVIASMQPTHCTSDMGWAVDRLGPERSKGSYAWRQVLKSGAHMAFGSDFPVEEVSPLLGIYAAVTRQDSSGKPPGGFFPAERLDLEEAIRAFSLEGAYASFVEPFRGAIRSGGIADLTVYDRKLKGDTSLLSTRIRMTIVNGTVVFERE